MWLDVFRHVGRLADPAAFPAWVYRIARRSGPAALAEALAGIDDVIEETIAARSSEPVFTAEDAQRVHAALDELPPEHREVLLLRFLEELSYEEIARVVGLPLGTVRSRIHYAKRGLKQPTRKGPTMSEKQLGKALLELNADSLAGVPDVRQQTWTSSSATAAASGG